MPTDTPQRRLAAQKLALTPPPGTNEVINASVSCGNCGVNSTHKFGDLTEKEESHQALNLKTGKMETHYKLSYYCPKNNIAILSAVVWNHEISGGTS